MSYLREFYEDEEGMGVVEIVLIIGISWFGYSF